MSRRCPEHPVSGTFVLDLGHDTPVCVPCLREARKDGAPIEATNEETPSEAPISPRTPLSGRRAYPAPGGPTREI